MMRRALLLAVCGLAFCSALHAAEARGTRSCRKWTEERRIADGTKEMNKVPVLISKSWFLGYLAGRQPRGAPDFLAATDNESIFLWLDNYCRDHPQDDLSSAAQALQQELAPGKSQPQRR
jgi:hypothetical protein